MSNNIICDVFAERALLSCLIINSASIKNIELQIDDFYDAFHREIYKAIVELENNCEEIDAITVRERLKSNSNIFDDVEFAEIIDVNGVNYVAYAQIIAKYAKKRNETSLLNEVANGKITVQAALAKLNDVDAETREDDEEYSDAEILNLDGEQRFIAGFPSGYISVVAGAGGIGKTYMLMKIAAEASVAGARVLVWLTEDNILQLRERIKYISNIYNQTFTNVTFKTKMPNTLIEKTRSGIWQKTAGFSEFKKTIKNYDLVVADPLMNFTSGFDVIDNSANREFFNAVKAAMTAEQSLIFSHHVNKKIAERLSVESVDAFKLSSDEAAVRLDKIKGASAILETCRFAAYVESNPSPGAEFERVISVIKSNCSSERVIFNSVTLPSFFCQPETAPAAATPAVIKYKKYKKIKNNREEFSL